MRRLLLLATLLLVAPASSPAATRWGEAPAVELGSGKVATCVRDAGGGRVAALAERDGRFGGALYTVGADGLHADGEALLGRWLEACPAVAAAESGAAVVAATVRQRSREQLQRPRLVVSVRDAGGGFAPPLALARLPALDGTIEPAVAIGADGSALVAWLERPGAFRPRGGRLTVRVARRPPGGRFGPAETLIGGTREGEVREGALAVAVDVAGGATVAWEHPRPPQRERRGTIDGLASIDVATAPPGGAFGPPQRLEDEVQYVTTLALAVAPGGRALLAHDGNERVRVYEREGAAAPFAPVRIVGEAGDPAAGPPAAPGPGGDPNDSAERPAVALAADGGAVVAWRSGDAVDAVARTASGAFGPPQRLQRKTDAGDIGSSSVVFAGDGTPVDNDDGRLRAVAAPGGRAAIAWLVPGDPLRGPASARLAPATDGAFAPAVVLGGPALDVEGAVPWLDTGGRAAVYTENRTRLFGFAVPSGAGRLRLAQAARPPANPPAPGVRLTARPQALFHGDPLFVDARCAAACDLRATVAPRRAADVRTRGAAFGTATRATAGRVRVVLDSPPGSHIAPRGGGRVRVTVVASAPGGTATSRAVGHVRVSRRPVPPFFPPLDVRARRAGDDVIVTWRTAGPARRTSFAAYTRRTRGKQPTLSSSLASRPGRGDRRFRVRIEDARAARWVVVLAAADDPPQRFRRVVVRVDR